MRNILSSLIIIFSISCAFADDQCSGRNYNSTQCNNIAGCYYDTDYNSCEQCNSTEYSYSGETICNECSDFAFTETSHKIYDTTTPGQAGQSECPWICDTGYFDDDEHSECLSCPDASHPKSYENQEIDNIGTCTCPTNTDLIKTIESTVDKYYCGQCGAGTPTTQGGITTCSCLTGANHINGNMPPQGNIRVECLCSGTFVDGQCVCPLNKYLHQDNNGVYSCESCPDHSTSAQGSTDVNDCQCISNFPNRILDENGKLIGCSACANNAVFDNGLCKCNYGYYGNGTSSCTQCPTGMTTNNLGAIDIASCVMKSNTKFCTVSQNRTLCLNFIPAGTQINYPGTSH